MSAYSKTHWIKLYVEMLDDPKVGLLPDAVKWRWVSVLLLAGEMNEDGFLPDVNDMAWRLHTNVETLQGEMRMLAGRGLAELRLYVDGSERWFLPAFARRQAAASSTERSRMSRHNARQNAGRNANATNTQRNVATPSHKQKQKQNTETEGGTTRATSQTPPPASPPSPPVKVIHQSTDRSPGGRTFTPPAEPEPKPPDSRPSSPEVAAIGEIANALTDVTGVSARLNWAEVGGLAAELHEAGYSADQVRLHYGRDPSPGMWHWYTDDWRGKKNDQPRLKEIRETIAGATQRQASPTKKRRVDPILAALATLGGPPAPQEA